MDELKAKEMVVKAGKQLVESGLIVRTWGNVSCRIDKNRIAITPSGKPYENLSPEDIVVVNLADESYEGNIKPSSEKGFHVEVYRQRPEINFVVHTHQINASLVSPLQRDIVVTNKNTASITGEKIVCAEYGLPGSKKLKQAVSKAVTKFKGKGFLLAYHGALCLGESYGEAFRVASYLEEACQDFLIDQFHRVSGKNIDSLDSAEMRNYFLQQKNVYSNQQSPIHLYNSIKKGEKIILYPEASVENPFPSSENNLEINLKGSLTGEIPPEHSQQAILHRAIYRKNKNLGAVVHTTYPEIMTVSQTGQKMLPLLDDFAQIIGPSVKVASSIYHPFNIARKFNLRSAVLIKNNGALCCGPNQSDANAAALVMEKGCKTLIATSIFKFPPAPINALESWLMRIIYLAKYSRQA